MCVVLMIIKLNNINNIYEVMSNPTSEVDQ